MSIESNDCLSMWTIYDRPADHPQGFIARKWLVGCNAPNGVATATFDSVDGDDLEEVRDKIALRAPGLVCMQRDPNDDPKIVETWL